MKRTKRRRKRREGERERERKGEGEKGREKERKRSVESAYQRSFGHSHKLRGILFGRCSP